ncbi:hypothetical protein Dimus_002595 [Dionaea muscipula]
MGSSTAYTFKVQGASKITRSVREAPPAHYLFEIESFASLKNSVGQATTKHIDSSEFDAAGYKWVLVIYPNGNTNDDGDDHISLYLKLIDKLDHGCSVHATFKFFIYDYKRKTYLTIQGLADTIYDAMEKEKGIATALPLSDFTSSSNGFVKNDRCMFGVEVFVIDTIARNVCLSTLKQRTNSIYTWAIQEFSDITDGQYSDHFTREGRSWRLQIYPRGWGAGQGKSLSLYLSLVDFADLTNGKKLYVEKELSVKNLQNHKDATKTSRGWFTKSSHCWGISNLLSVSDLRNANKGFKVDDKVIVEVKLNLMMLTKDI